jgi:hypothetical protein
MFSSMASVGARESEDSCRVGGESITKSGWMSRTKKMLSVPGREKIVLDIPFP